MASPQLDRGFVMLACELLAATFSADFPKFEQMCLCLLMAAQHGPEKKAGEFLDPVEMARILRCHPNSFRRAIKSLLEGGAIVANPDGSHSLVEDWERWLYRPDRPRLLDGERAFVAYVSARYAARSAPSHKHQYGARAPQLQPSKGARAPQLQLSKRARAPHTTSDGSAASNGHVHGSGHITQIASDLIGREEEEEENTHTKEGASSGLAPPPPACWERGEGSPRRGKKSRVEHDPRADRLVAWVRAALAAEDYGPEALDEAEALCRDWFATGLDPEWCAQSFHAAIGQVGVLDKTPYARKILRRLYSEHRAGLPVVVPSFCDFKADPEGEPAPAPAAPAPAPWSRTDAAMEAYRRGFAANKARKEADRDGA